MIMLLSAGRFLIVPEYLDVHIMPLLDSNNEMRGN